MKISTKKEKRYVATISESELRPSVCVERERWVAADEAGEVKRVELSLSKREAEILMCLAGGVSGETVCSIRAFTSPLYDVLTRILDVSNSYALGRNTYGITDGASVKATKHMADYKREE